MERLKTVSLCMIVKNEEKYLQKCLQSVAGLVDEMIVVDTGSRDNTVAIAKQMNAKVLEYQWDNNFSSARNYSISNASSDWILLMDGDDEFNPVFYDEFINLVNTSEKDGHYMKTMSYTGNMPGKDIVTNLNLRLLRNNKRYKFIGAIHEQISCIDGPTDYTNLPSTEIEIFHYGYLTNVAVEKDKRTRNMSIIEEELKNDTKNNFHKFNLGNEYFALGDIEKAYELFDEVYNAVNHKAGYASKLIIRRIMCLMELMRYDNAEKAIDEGLNYYPEFTDLEFLRGCSFLRRRRYFLAVESFQTCLKKGKPPTQLEFIEGCGDYRAYEALGDIYLKFQSYEKAIGYYENAIKCNAKLQIVVYKIATACNKLYTDKNYVAFMLKQYFNLDYTPNLLLIANVLLKEGICDLALGYIEKAYEISPNDPNVIFLMGKALFYLNRYEDSQKYFDIVGDTLHDETFKYKFLYSLLNSNSDMDTVLESVVLDNNELSKRVYAQLYSVYSGSDDIILLDEDNHEMALELAIAVLEDVLLSREFELFEKLLNVLNYFNSKNVLLSLAKLYNKHGYGQLAVTEILRSIKQFDAIDSESVEILFREMR